MKSLLSIDIGTKNLHFVEGGYAKGIVTVQKTESVPIPEGCIRDDAVENVELLAETIKDAIKKGDFKANEVLLTINACNAIVRDIDLPAAKPKELDKMIRTELYQTFNVVNTDVIQYKFIEKVNGDTGTSLDRYRVVAIDADLIDSYHNLIKATKLKAIAMDINLNAIDKIFAGDIMINDSLVGDETIMLLDFGDTYSTLYFVCKGKPIFYRHVKIGSKEIEKIIAEETFTPLSEVLKLKESEYSFFSDEESSKKNYVLLKPFFYRFTDEIRKIMGFYSSRANLPAVGHIYLFGQGNELTGISEYFESNLNLPTEKIKTLSNITIKNSDQLLPIYLNAIGALIRS